MTPGMFVMTGAPGAGKTAILRELGTDVTMVAEPAREILADLRLENPGMGPDPDPPLFNALLLQRSIDKYNEAQRANGMVIFDRAIPDCIAYARWRGTDEAPSIRAAARYRYSKEVLVARPWEAIYTTDDKRIMTYTATVEFHEMFESAYLAAGYRLIEVPRGTIEERATFVREFIAAR